MKPVKSLVALLLASVLVQSIPASAANGPSAASAHSSAALSLVAGSIIVGTASTLSEAGKLSVEAIEYVGESVIIVVKDVSTGVTVSIKTAAGSVGAASVALGTIVTVVTDASGHALMASGKMIAYIPNEVGKSLIHSKKSLEREVRL